MQFAIENTKHFHILFCVSICVFFQTSLTHTVCCQALFTALVISA